MKTTITAKLKLDPTPQQFAALRATALAYRDALNFVSRYAFAHGKISSKGKLQAGTYRELRSRFHLPSQMACSVCRQVGASYQTLWKRVQQNATARKAGHTKKRYKGLDQPPKYLSPTLTYQDRKDYSFKAGSRVSLLTLEGRVIVSYRGYDKHVALIQQGKGLGTGLLWYDKAHQQFYLLVSLTIQTADPTLAELVRHDWISTGTLSKCPDVSSNEIKAARLRRYAELRWSSDTSPRRFSRGSLTARSGILKV